MLENAIDLLGENDNNQIRSSNAFSANINTFNLNKKNLQITSDLKYRVIHLPKGAIPTDLYIGINYMGEVQPEGTIQLITENQTIIASLDISVDKGSFIRFAENDFLHNKLEVETDIFVVFSADQPDIDLDVIMPFIDTTFRGGVY